VSADTWAVVLVIIAAPPATLFPFCFAYISRGIWWRNPTGRALMTSSTGLALLIDISLLYNWLGDDYALRDAVRLTVFAVIAAGAWLKLGALLHTAWRARGDE
jgi:hypothetical protein